METDFDLIGVGALNVDRVFRVYSLESMDSELIASTRSVAYGGSAANTVYALARLGAHTACVGAVGKDADGEALRKDLARAGVDTRWVLLKDSAPTGEAICLADETGRRLIILGRSASDQLSLADVQSISSGRLSGRILHFSAFVDPGQIEVQAALAGCLDPSALVSLSPGSLDAERGLMRLTPLADRCHILFANRREICRLMSLPESDYRRAALDFLRRFDGCQTVVITLGSGEPIDLERPMPGVGGDRASCWVASRSEGQFVVQFGGSPDKVEGTGAGDAFAAGYLYGLLAGEDIGRCALYGHTMAQFAIVGVGGRESLPTSAELQVAIDQTSATVVRL